MDIIPEQIEAMKSNLKEMSAADLSILAALSESLREEESVRLATIPGSKNDQLWSKMAELHWMTLDTPLEEHPTSKVYIVRREALEPIETVLLELKRDELPTLFDELRRDIPNLIVPRVIAAGGTPSDVALMLAGIVDTTMRGWIRDELHEEFLRTVFDRAKDLGREPRL